MLEASSAGGHLARHRHGSGTARGIHPSVPELPATRCRWALGAMKAGSARGGLGPAFSSQAPRRRRCRGRDSAASARAGVVAVAAATLTVDVTQHASAACWPQRRTQRRRASKVASAK